MDLQSRLCRMSKVLLVFKDVTARVPSCMCWHVWQLRRDGHLDIPLRQTDRHTPISPQHVCPS